MSVNRFREGLLSIVSCSLLLTATYAHAAGDSVGTLTAAGGIAEPVNIPTTAASGTPVSVFDFTISDGDGVDGLTLDVSQINLNLSGSASGNFSKLRFNLSGCATKTGVAPSGSTVSFTSTAISVANGGTTTCTVAAYWNDNTGITDNQTVAISVNGDTDLTIDTNNTNMSGSNTTVSTGNMATTVTATALSFSTQPAGSTSGSALSTQPEVAAVDAANNVDQDFTETVTLTESSAGTLSGGSIAAVSGVATFTSVNYTATADQQSFTLTANDQDGVGSNLPTTNSNSVTSDVVATKLLFTTEPVPTTVDSGVSTAFTTVPVVSAVDAATVVDTGYGTDIALAANGAGSATMSGTGDTDGNGTTVTLTPTSGAATFTGLNVTYTASGSSNEMFTLRATSGGLTLADSTNITAQVNTPPTLTAFAGPLDTTDEDTEVEITLAEIQAQGNETDTEDGTVSKFVIKAVTTGTLKIGTSAGSATAWAASTNDTVDGSNNAYWIPASNANGTLNSFTVVAKDSGGLESSPAVQATVSVTAVNDAPTLTSFAGSLDSTNEDTEVEITLAEIQAQGNEADTEDGTVSKFVIKAVSTGTLKIGASAGSATAWAASTNDTVNGSKKAYWTPASNVSGTQNAFTVVAEDSGAQESSPAVQATVSVTAVNDAPTLTAFTGPLDTTNEDTEVEITLAEIQSQGNEADTEDGTVSKFVIKAVSTGTLKMGTSAGSATAWAASTNDTVDGSNKAYWTPASNASGTQNAFTVVAEDSGALESSPAVQATVSVTAVNDAPTTTNLNGDSFTYTEGDPATVIDQGGNATVADVDSVDFNTGNLTVTISAGKVAAEDILSLDTSGTVSLAGTTAGSNVSVGGSVVGTLGNSIAAGNNLVVNFTTANATPANVQTLVRAITYENSNAVSPTTGARTVRTTINDGDGGTSANADVTITVAATNDPPATTNLNGDSFTYTEGDLPTVIDQGANATVVDVDSADFNTGNLTVAITSGGDATEDVLGLDTSGTVSLSGTTAGSSVKVGGSTVGTLGNSIAAGNDLVVNFTTSNATPANVQTLVRAITYQDSDTDAPTAGARNIRTTIDDGDGGTSANANVTVTVAAVNDDPAITSLPTDVTVTEDTPSNVDLSAATFSDADSGANNVTLKIAAGVGTLTASSSGGVTVSGSGTGTITLTGTAANIDAFLNTASNIQYTGPSNTSGTAVTSLTLTANDGGNTGAGGGTNVSLGTVNVNITAVADTPSVTNATTDEDTQTTSGLVIDRNPNDGIEVTYFKITNIIGGTLYKSNGTTQINNNDFITFAEGNAGLKFTPSANSFSSGSFNVQAATDGVGGGLSTGSATATIIVNPVGDTPSVTNATTDEDTQSTSGLVISRNVNDGTEVTHFKITGISGGTLYKNNGTTQITNGSFITFAEGNAGLKFTPSANSIADGTFYVQAGTGGSGGGLSAGGATATITVTPIADMPSVTNTTTDEDTPSTSGLVISRNVNDGTEVTHFKITGISGGTLYQNNGSTQISDGSFITYSEGHAGLKFTPSANSTADGTFYVQAGTDGSGGGLSAGSAQATISINPVNDPPTISNLNGDSVDFSVGGTAVVLDAGNDATLSDVDSTNFDGGNVTAYISKNGQNLEDVLQVEVGTVGSIISTSESNVNHSDGVTIGTVSGGSGGSPLVVTLNSDATVARVRDLLSALQYRDTDPNTNNLKSRTVRVRVDDGDGGDSTSGPQDVTVKLTTKPVVDLDVDNSSGASNNDFFGSFIEDGGEVPVSDSDVLVSDADLTPFKSLTVTLNNRPNGGAESLSSTYPPGSQTVNSEPVTVGAYNSGTGVLKITVNDSIADAQTMQMLVASIRYNNSSNAPDLADRIITFVITGSDNKAGPASTATISVAGTNDPVGGSVTISGTATEHLQLTANTSAITDPDGLPGSFNYQWKRNGSNISGATASTYTLVRADVGATITVRVSYTDNGGTTESLTSAPTTAVAGDYDGDTIVDSIDTDDDNDGMLDVWEVANGLDQFNAADASGDLDGDGLTNLKEFEDDKDPNVDDNPPVVIPPADVNADATALFTAVDIGSGAAVDAKDGALLSVVTQVNGVDVSDTPTHFSPGSNTVTWTATDAAGNSASASQNVNVTPLVNFSKDQVSREGDSVTFSVILNGKAVNNNPVTVPYTVGGTAATDGSDHDLVDGSIIITSPSLETSVTVQLWNDGVVEGSEDLVVTMGTPVNAVQGGVTTHTITIEETNVAPQVTLTADQGSGATRLIDQGGGSVTVTAAVTDSPGDTHSYNWSATDNALVDTDVVSGTFSFDPAGLVPGLYTMRVAVSDGIDTTNAVLLLNVVATPPTLNAGDSDGDGVDDTAEGYGDSDGDGVPNYLDNNGIARNVIQEQSNNASQYLMETEPGLVLSMGNVAFPANGDHTAVVMDDVITYGNDGVGGVADEGHGYSGGLFDFSVNQLPVAGQQVRVVIPQLAAIPADATYRKLMSSGWQEFVVDANNSIASAPGAQGYCPPPGDAAYSNGLSEGDWCVQLTIEDGGPNDTDGVINLRVSDPGGVAGLTSKPVTIVVRSGGGGGALSPWWLILLIPLVARRVGRGKGHLLVALPLLLGGSAARAESLLMPDYIGFNYLAVKGNGRSHDFQSDLNALGLNATVSQSHLSRSGWMVYAGYRMKSILSLEVGYVDLGDATTTINGSTIDINSYLSTASAVHPYSAQGLMVDAVLREELYENINLLAGIGALLWHSEYTLSSTTTSRNFTDGGMGGSLELALETKVRSDVPLRLGWSHYYFSGAHVSAFGLGIGYLF